ncbi:MAG: ABC transporter permease subunit [Candidatus Bathyarchaeota archaeon]|nr:ABC transporter permease subunit [Candidatus Bathyarchaeota archaeon A05DMB-5]MDH7558538.1 ABC transporter permease subunit [Candidatus Bathyarchaeota archaeon]
MRKYIISFVGGLIILCMMTWLIVAFIGYSEIKNLPLYTLSTISRIVITLLISIAWGVSFGILAATNKIASFILTPLIDLLQSIPILGYFPMVIGFLFALGPFGIEISVIVLLFTSMAWAIFFGVLGAIRGIPTNVVESARSFGLTGWRYIRHVVLPAITPAVISGANLAWCDGWFFMIAAEYIQYKGNVVAPPSGGLGYLLARAAYFYQDMTLSIILLIFITFIVVYFNTLTWHKLMERASTGTFKPVFRMDLSGVGKLGILKSTSWLHFGRLHWPKSFFIVSQRLRKYTRIEKLLAVILAFSGIFFALYIVSGQLPTFAVIRGGFNEPPAEELGRLPLLIALTMGRLTIAYGISLVVAIGMGVLAAEHKRFAAIFYPLYDIGQGVPILALFPVIFLGLNGLIGVPGIALELTCILMLVLDMIWYMFLNIVSAVKNIPTEIKEVGQIFGFKGFKRITHIVIPSILPSIVTGSILSWGTGWNTIIFAEYMPSTEPTISPLSVPGLGSLLDKAGYEYGNTVMLIFLLGIVAIIVLSMEAFLWRRLLRKFEKYHVEV